MDSVPPFTEYTATRWYRAPEQIIMYGNYDEKVDIFSIGTIMAELYLQKPIFCGKSDIDQLSLIYSILGTPSEDIFKTP
jgi:serine/threonine protein kinase